MIDWKSKQELKCRECSRTINIEGLASRDIEEKLKENDWATTMTAPACPKHHYKNKEVES